MFGCGCWTECYQLNSIQNKESTSSNLLVACSATGTGEQLIYSMMAKECCTALIQDTLSSDSKEISQVVDNFMKTKFLQEKEEKKYGGLIALRFHPDSHCLDFVWSHSTGKYLCEYLFNDSESMGIAFMSDCDSEPQVVSEEFNQLTKL